MKVLIIDNLATDNDYVRILYNALSNISEIDVRFGVNALFSETKFDVLHFQWPESIFNWKSITKKEVDKIAVVLNTKKKKIVTTVHNLHPHHFKKAYQPLYNLLISRTNTFIHHCSESREKFQLRYNTIIMKSANHEIINHHLYQKKENTSSNLKIDLKIKDHEKVVLVLGNIRNYTESKFILRAFKTLEVTNKKLIVPRFCFNSIETKYLRTISKWWNSQFISDKKNMVLSSRKLDADQIPDYLGIADVLFVPRIDSLNSGLVYLGLTYGKKIVGPNFGCIGSTLSETFNYTFTPNSSLDAAFQIKKAINDQKPKESKLYNYRIENLVPLYLACYRSSLKD